MKKSYVEISREVLADVQKEGYWPNGISETDKKNYIKLEIDTRFNDEYGINQIFNNNMKYMKHQIIAMYR